MATEQEILEKAAELGEMIAEHDAVKKLQSAANAFQADVNSQRAMTDYQRMAQTLQQKAQQGGAIEVEDKHKLEALQQAVVTNPLLANMQRAEMDYVDLLRKVDAALLGSDKTPTPEAAGPVAGSSPIFGG